MVSPPPLPRVFRERWGVSYMCSASLCVGVPVGCILVKFLRKKPLGEMLFKLLTPPRVVVVEGQGGRRRSLIRA